MTTTIDKDSSFWLDTIKFFVEKGANETVAIFWSKGFSLNEIIQSSYTKGIEEEVIAKSIGVLYNLTEEHAKIVVDRRISKRRFIRVSYENGDFTDTEINGTKEEIEYYYIGNRFELLDGETYKCVGIEFID